MKLLLGIIAGIVAAPLLFLTGAMLMAIVAGPAAEPPNPVDACIERGIERYEKANREAGLGRLDSSRLRPSIYLECRDNPNAF